MSTTAIAECSIGMPGKRIVIPYASGMKAHIKAHADKRNVKGHVRRFSSKEIEVLVYGYLSDVMHLHDIILKLLLTHFDSLDGMVFVQDLPTSNVIEEPFFIHPTCKSVKSSICKETGTKEFSCGAESTLLTSSLHDHLALEKSLIRLKAREERIKQQQQQHEEQELEQSKRIIQLLLQMEEKNVITTDEALVIANMQHDSKNMKRMILILDMYAEIPDKVEYHFKKFLTL